MFRVPGFLCRCPQDPRLCRYCSSQVSIRGFEYLGVESLQFLIYIRFRYWECGPQYHGNIWNKTILIWSNCTCLFYLEYFFHIIALCQPVLFLWCNIWCCWNVSNSCSLCINFMLWISIVHVMYCEYVIVSSALVFLVFFPSC